MASDPVDTSHGITAVFGTSSFTAQLMDVNYSGITLDDIDTSHQGTTDSKTFIPSDLIDGGEITLSVHHNPDTAIPVVGGGAPETLTMTWPSTATWASNVYFKGYAVTATHLDRIDADVTIKIADEITVTAAV